MEKRVNFESGDKTIDGIIYLPSETGNSPGVIVLHPHPAFGGSMENNVVNAICRELSNNGIIAFKFDIRNPKIETAIQYAKNGLDYFMKIPELDKSRIGVCGYSWGSRVILGAFHNDPRIKFLVGVSPPISMMKFSFLLESEKPKLITVGTHDQIIPTSQIENFFDKFDPLQASVPYLVKGDIFIEIRMMFGKTVYIYSQTP